MKEYLICPDLECDISKIGVNDYLIEDEPFRVEVIDSVQDYLELMKEVFDFPLIKSHLSGGFKILINCMHGGNNCKVISLLIFLCLFTLQMFRLIVGASIL